MRRNILLISLLLAVSPLASATEEASARLREIKTALERMGCYSVQFAVETEKGQIGGNYSAEGRNFYMSVAENEIYVRDGVRYEVDRRKREVAIDKVDAASSDPTVNPTLDFSSLLEKYDSEIAATSDGEMILLHPKKGAKQRASIRIYIRSGERLPSEIDYVVRNGQIRIRIISVGKRTSALPVYSKEKYATFETFDYR